MSETSPAARALLQPTKKPKYVRAVGPRLRVLLYIVFALVSLLTANSVYLASITALGRFSGQVYENFFYLCMFLLHLVLGLLLIVPFLVFGIIHLSIARKRRNRRAVRMGYALFTVSIVLLVSGVLLMRVGGVGLKNPTTRGIVYWLHVASPLVAAWLYWLHRLAGPRIKWKVGGAYAGAVAVLVVLMVFLQAQDPRQWAVVGSAEGVKYFEPSLTRTADGNFIPDRALMNDQYCLKCHQDAYEGWFHSAHHLSSFNNPAYLASISETREVALNRDGDVKASRWCAGCHDPVPFLSGKFDDPEYDIIDDPTAQAGITCTVCHAMTHVNSNRGNGDYTIEEPLHYPFAYSDNSLLQFINNQLVKAKPAFHKKSMLKPFHKTAEFCSTCHKVHLPKELNDYKDFLRGQNHYDPFLLSGVSGHGARSFYYPPTAQANCNGCHMPLEASHDFGARDFDGTGELKIHNHLFPAANTGIAYLNDSPETIKAHQQFLDGVMRVDIFGVKAGESIAGEVSEPLRPQVPALEPGKPYVLETIIRTLKMGHLFTQGTVDSNEVWLDVTVNSGGKLVDGAIVGGETIGRSGGQADDGEVDPWSHFVNVFMLDRKGNRIDRRNAQDIFVPLYNHQIPPGAAQVVHYRLQLPENVTAPVIVEVKLQYRKFDTRYMQIIAGFHEKRNLQLRDLQPGQEYVNKLPVTTLAVDRVVFPIAGDDTPVENDDSPIPLWQRWNDYGIGLLLEGKTQGEKGELLQAEQAFLKVKDMGQYHGLLNLSRVYDTEGRLNEAVASLNELKKTYGNEDGFPSWTVAWLTGVINRKQGNFDAAIEDFEFVLDNNDSRSERVRRGFDFSRDYDVINELGQTLYQRALQERGGERIAERNEFLQLAVARFQQTLAIDSENVAAHYNLSRIDGLLSEREDDEFARLAAEHERLHKRYRPDDNAREAIELVGQKYPAAIAAARAGNIYPLRRPGAPELPEAYELRDETQQGDAP